MKVALLFICLNHPYWTFINPVLTGARKHFLPNHKVDMFLWSDVPDTSYDNTTIIPTESVAWPMPTLLRYHLFLQQEEKLKDYDYIFYCDIDMEFRGDIGDEILGEGLTAVHHPMYDLRKEFLYPYEPNPQSTAYLPQPSYFAGGFQGGKSEPYLKAMRVLKNNIDADFVNNYIARWNEESHWNRYLAEFPPHTVLRASVYCCPDSLIENYYKKIWGDVQEPKLVTLTKKFTTNAEGGKAINDIIKSL